MSFQIIEQYASSEYSHWLKFINIHISNNLKESVLNARRILWKNETIGEISIFVPENFLHEDSKYDLYRHCKFNHRINIYDFQVDYFIQSAWSEMIFTKYDLTTFLPHPMAIKIEEQQHII